MAFPRSAGSFGLYVLTSGNSGKKLTTSVEEGSLAAGVGLFVDGATGSSITFGMSLANVLVGFGCGASVLVSAVVLENVKLLLATEVK